MMRYLRETINIISRKDKITNKKDFEDGKSLNNGWHMDSDDGHVEMMDFAR